MKLQDSQLSAYLLDDPYLKINCEDIVALCHRLFDEMDKETDIIRKAFKFVLDQIDHSWDIKQTKVSISASDVLENGHGICYAKVNLLAALLKAMHIPTGFCYQKLLLFSEAEGKYCIHALNAVYLRSQNRWIRLDARGNKLGIHAACSFTTEKLAFYPDRALGERDYDMIYVRPNPLTMAALEASSNILTLYVTDLPDNL